MTLNSKIKTLIVIIILVFLFIAGYYFFVQPVQQNPSSSLSESTPSTTLSSPTVDELLQKELTEGQQVTVTGTFIRTCKHPNSGCISRLFGEEKYFILNLDNSQTPPQNMLLTISGTVRRGYCGYIKEDINKFKECGLKNITILNTEK